MLCMLGWRRDDLTVVGGAWIPISPCPGLRSHWHMMASYYWSADTDGCSWHVIRSSPTLYRLGQPQVAWLNDEEDGVLTIGLGLLLALGELTTSSATRVLYSCLCLPAASNHNSWLRPSMAHRLLHGPRELTWLTGVGLSL